MSHEFRTPLTAILGFADVLADEAPPDLQDYAEIIGRGGRRLLDTLDSVLALAQIEAGEMTVSPEPVDLYAEAGRACASLGPLALEKGLEMRLVGEPACALADRQAVGRILDKLIGNAIKFTSEGSVTVEVGEAEGRVGLRVTDTGAGISAEFLSDLFDEFTQESEGHHRAYEGSGLGLTITKRLVGLMGGEIGVESEKGVGSAFTVALPAAAEPVDAAGRPLVGQGSPAGRGTARAA
jgi:signal transduction histidine kinase